MILFLLACVADEPDCGDPTESRVALITSLDFARQEENGVSRGFDLDGVDGTCNKDDLVHPDGTGSIDNAFSHLLPALEATEAVAINGLLSDSINSGELLLLPEMTKVDDDRNDECVDVAIWRGEGSPLLGTDGLVLEDQSFGRNTDVDPGQVTGVSLVDGVVTGGPFEMDLPIQVLDFNSIFSMSQGQLRVEWHDDGTVTGEFGGAIPIAQILEITNYAIDFGDLLEELLYLAADLDPDENGDCQSISLTFTFEGRSAYFYEDSVAP